MYYLCRYYCVILKGIIMSRKPRPASPILNIVNVFTAKSWVGLLLYNIHICFNDCSHHYHYHHTLPRPGDSVVTIFIIISSMFPFLSVILNLISNQNWCFPSFIVRHQAAIAGTVGFAFLVAICMEQVSISFFLSKFHLTWKSQSIIKDHDNLIIWVKLVE